MNKEVPDVPEGLREARKQGLVIPFIGAGLSSAVVRPGAAAPPSYDEFIELLIDGTSKNLLNAHARKRLKEKLRTGQSNAVSIEVRKLIPESDFHLLVRDIFRDIDPKASQHHVILNLLRFKLLLTTNYDRILDQVITPRPEVYTYLDLACLNAVLDDEFGLVEGESAPMIVKLNGDVTLPSTLALGRSSEIGMWNTGPQETNQNHVGIQLFEFFSKLMSEFSILFLGYSFQDTDFRNFFGRVGKSLGDKCRQHYALLPEADWDKLGDNAVKLHANANIIPLQYELARGKNQNPHRGLWQFLSQISPAIPLEYQNNQRIGSFYLPEERQQYLAEQDKFEKSANSLRYITPTLTNAVATAEYIDIICRQNLTDEFENIISSENLEQWLDEVVNMMQQRRVTLEEKLAAGCELRILCSKLSTQKELKKNNKVVIDRYHHLLTMLEDPQLDIELRLYRSVSERESVTSYASLLRANSLGSDIAVAYATQATTARFKTHIMEINTNFAEQSLVTFEKEWVRADTEQQSMRIIRELLNNRQAEVIDGK